MIRDVQPGSRIRILIFYPSRIPDPGVKKAPDPGSWIRNTGHRNFHQNGKRGVFRETLLQGWKECFGSGSLSCVLPDPDQRKPSQKKISLGSPLLKTSLRRPKTNNQAQIRTRKSLYHIRIRINYTECSTKKAQVSYLWLSSVANSYIQPSLASQFLQNTSL